MAAGVIVQVLYGMEGYDPVVELGPAGILGQSGLVSGHVIVQVVGVFDVTLIVPLFSRVYFALNPPL